MAGIDVIEGAKYRKTGVFRPKLNCLMRELKQELCEICLERSVQRFFENVSLIDGARSSLLPIFLKEGEAYSMEVKTVAPEKAVLEPQWFLDGKPVEGTVKEGPNGPIYTANLKPEQLRIGTRLLRFVVRNNTKLTESWPTTVKTHAPCTKQWMITVRPTLPRLPFLGNGD